MELFKILMQMILLIFVVMAATVWGCGKLGWIQWQEQPVTVDSIAAKLIAKMSTEDVNRVMSIKHQMT